jgi:hypothetical protein
MSDIDDNFLAALPADSYTLRGFISEKLYGELTYNKPDAEQQALTRARHHQQAIYRLISQKNGEVVFNELIDTDIMYALSVQELYLHNGDKTGAEKWYEQARDLILAHYGEWKTAAEDKARPAVGWVVNGR